MGTSPANAFVLDLQPPDLRDNTCLLLKSSIYGTLLQQSYDKYKEIEENNRMGKTRALIKKIRDTKGTFHAKVSLIKDRNVIDLTEAEDIKQRKQEYTEELYKKDLHDPDNHNGVITHLEPDILKCEVKWALESITTKLVEVMKFQLSYFKS